MSLYHLWEGLYFYVQYSVQLISSCLQFTSYGGSLLKGHKDINSNNQIEIRESVATSASPPTKDIEESEETTTTPFQQHKSKVE